MAKKKQQKTEEPKVFINPFTDFGFKKIFGEEPNKDLLIDFLNQLLLEQDLEIKDLTYKKNEHLGTSDLDRKVVFDLYCENAKGEKFIVEMQKAKQSFFKDRTLFYSTFPIQEQAPKSSKWNYELKSVFAVAILDFAFDDEDKNETIVNRVQLIDKKTFKVFYDKLTFIFVQMENFNKSIDELETRLDMWLYVLKNLEKFDRIPEKIKDKILQKVFKIAEYHQLSKKEQSAYENSLKYYRDLKNSFDTAREEGYQEGYQGGYQEAEKKFQFKLQDARKREAEERRQREEAQQREAEERRQREEAQRKLHKAAKRMHKRGFSVSEIAEDLEVSEQTVKKILEQ